MRMTSEDKERPRGTGASNCLKKEGVRETSLLQIWNGLFEVSLQKAFEGFSVSCFVASHFMDGVIVRSASLHAHG